MQCSRKRMFFLRNCPESIKHLYGGRGVNLDSFLSYHITVSCPIYSFFFSPFLSFLSTKYFVFNSFPSNNFFSYTSFCYSWVFQGSWVKAWGVYQGPTILAGIEQFLSAQYHKTRNLLLLLDSQMQLLGFLAFPLEHDGGIAVPKGTRWAPFSAVFSSPWSWPSIPPYLW